MCISSLHKKIWNQSFRKSEKSASIVRDDSFTNIANSSNNPAANARLASAPPENGPSVSSTINQRRSRFDTNTNSSHEHLPLLTSSTDDAVLHDIMSNSVIATPTTNGTGTSKNRFFSLSRRFRFRVQSPEKETTTGSTQTTAQPATVHFLDEDIDLETKERTVRKSDQSGSRPSKGILKALRHRSPFRFRSKDAVIPEQEPSPPPQPSEQSIPSETATASEPAPAPPAPLPPKETRSKMPPPVPTTQGKQRGRLVELKKATPKSSSSTSSNGTTRKGANSTTAATTTTTEPNASGSTLVRRPSGLKDLIHKFEGAPSDRPPKPKRVTIDSNTSNPPTVDVNQEEQNKKGTGQLDVSRDDQQRLPNAKSKTVDMPDLLRNVAKDAPIPSTTTATRAILRHSNSSRQTASFDSATSMVSASESIITNSSMRRPTSTARPLMVSLSKDES